MSEERRQTDEDHVNESNLARAPENAGPTVSPVPSPHNELADRIQALLGDARKFRMHGEFAVPLDTLHQAIELAEGSADTRDLLYECHMERAFTLHVNMVHEYDEGCPDDIECREALSELRKAIELMPGVPEPYWWRLHYLRPQAGDQHQLDELSAVSELKLDAGWYYALHACWLRRTGDSQAAYEKACQAVESDPDLPHARLQKGRAAEALGRNDEAVEQYHTYLKHCGHSNELEQAFLTRKNVPKTNVLTNGKPAVFTVEPSGSEDRDPLAVFAHDRKGRSEATMFAQNVAASQLLQEQLFLFPLALGAVDIYECCNGRRLRIDGVFDGNEY